VLYAYAEDTAVKEQTGKNILSLRRNLLPRSANLRFVNLDPETFSEEVFDHGSSFIRWFRSFCREHLAAARFIAFSLTELVAAQPSESVL
jgi:hypothetical protein